MFMLDCPLLFTKAPELLAAYRIHQRNNSKNELTRQKTGRSDQGNLFLLANHLRRVCGFPGQLMHTQPATLIQPVIQDKTGTQFGHETFHPDQHQVISH
jgi:hypothetical protein